MRIAPNIQSVGVIDWSRRLFDSLIPLPEGTSYNSYLIQGNEKTAVIDTVDPSFTKTWLDNLKKAGVQKVDYFIANHAEQDHSGSLPEAIKAYPMALIVCTAKCQEILTDLLNIPAEKFLVVEDRKTLSLGDKTLQFIYAPWVHWPETMLTYCQEEQLLFSCDFFGAHFASSSILVEDFNQIYHPSKRYYAEIMLPFAMHIQKHLKMLEQFPIKIIAPSHGQVHTSPQTIMDAYQEWSSGAYKNKVILAYVSMHESTKIMAQHLTQALINKGIAVSVFDLTVADIGALAMELIEAPTVIVGSPTVLGGAHPAAAHAAFLVNALRPKTKYISIIGSFSWGGKMVEQLAGILTNIKPEIIPPVVCKGLPKEKELLSLEALAQTIAEKHSCLNCQK